MKQRILFILILCVLQTAAQPTRNQLVGDWKSYLKDQTSFEFLRLNPNGSGLKCFGQTINGVDTLFLNHVTALVIGDWKVTKDELVIKSKNTVSFDVNPRYKLKIMNDDKLELAGEHLIFYLYPSVLNRKEFQRTVMYERADKTSKDYGIKNATCIGRDRTLFSLTPVDSTFQIAEYKGFEDLIPHIVGCNYGYEYIQKYNDPPYTLQIPNSIHHWSFGFGNKQFYVSFDTDKGDTSETSIVIYYDFANEIKDYYFSRIKNGKEKKDIIRLNNLDIYRTINWEGKFEGKVFLKNSIIVAYYTRDEKLQQMLQQCICSFKYKL